MLSNHEYVNEKLRSFQLETVDLESSRPSLPSRHNTLVRPAVSAGGRAMRRLGESLERWAAMEPRGTSHAQVGYSGPRDMEPCTDC